MIISTKVISQVVASTTMTKILIELGLSLNEAKTYLGFLKYGEITAAELSRKIDMDKSSCYRAALNLETKGLLIKSNKSRDTRFLATEPNNLKTLLEDEKNKLKTKETELSNLINTIKDQAFYNTRETSIKIEKGLEAHLRSMEDSIKNNKEKVIYEKWEMKNPIFLNEQYKKFVYDFAKRRVKLKIKSMYLADSTVEGMFSNLMKTSRKLNKEVRIYPDDANDKNSFRIYKDTVEIVSFDEKGEFIVVTIKDKYITNLMKTMFMFIWNRSEVYNLSE